MNAKHFAVLALLGSGLSAGCVVYAPPPPPDAPYDEVRAEGPDATVEVGVFYDELTPYGRWVERPEYGRIWIPAGVAVGWRPYSLGRWVESDYGWTWVSEEPFGWATYHYGRWTEDPEFGWIWIPGREWGPAWVAWQSGGGYIGWAPLPPAVVFRAGIGLDFGRVVIAPRAYAFVEERAFLAPRVAILPVERNVTIIHNTTNVTHYTVVNHRVVNRSVDERHIEQVTGERIHHYRITDAPAGDQHRSGRIEGDQIGLYRPAAHGRPGRKDGQTGSPAVRRDREQTTTAPAESDRQHERDRREVDNRENRPAPERQRKEETHSREVDRRQHTDQQTDTRQQHPRQTDAKAQDKAKEKQPKKNEKKPDKKKDQKKDEKKD